MGHLPISMDKLVELRLRYQRSLPDKGRDILAQWEKLLAQPRQRSLLIELHQLVHRLNGSAPAYGFDAIGALARPIDVQIAEWLRADADDSDDAEQLVARLAAAVAELGRALLCVDTDEAAG